MNIWTWNVRSKGLGQADLDCASGTFCVYRRWLEKAKKFIDDSAEDIFSTSRRAAKAHGLSASSSTTSCCGSSRPSVS